MTEEKSKAPITAASPSSIRKAARILESGGLVALPTETVYGLAARADDEEAVTRIFEVKNRPAVNPLILHVASLKQAEVYAEISKEAAALARQFWPGPLTLVLPLKKPAHLAKAVTAGLSTIAIRAPAHPVARAILKELSCPFVAPSANKSGTISPTRAIDVARTLGEGPDLILADKNVFIGLESTILDLTVTPPAILRQGAVTPGDLAPLLPEISSRPAGQQTDSRPKAPGQMFRHYAPDLPLRLNAVDVRPDEALLAFGPIKFMGITGGGKATDLPDHVFRNLSETGDIQEAARNLYAMLHDLDKSGKQGIAVMPIPDKEIGGAINERLGRAQSSGQSPDKP